MPPPPYPTAPEALQACAVRVLAGAARQIPINAPSAGSGSGPGNAAAEGHAPGQSVPAEGLRVARDPGQGLGSADPGSRQPRVPEAARRALALEACVPLYVAPPAGGRGVGLPRRRLFRHAHTQLTRVVATQGYMQPELELAMSCVVGALVRQNGLFIISR